MNLLSSFKVGDRIICSAPNYGGLKGRIIAKGDKKIGVEFEEDIAGHSCDGMGKNHHCRWFYYAFDCEGSQKLNETRNQSITQIKKTSLQLELQF